MADHTDLAVEGGISLYEEFVDTIALSLHDASDVLSVGTLIQENVESEIGDQVTNCRHALYRNVLQARVLVILAKGIIVSEILLPFILFEALFREVEKMPPYDRQYLHSAILW